MASWSNYPTDYMHVRCVRHATVTVSSGGGSSSSGGSGNVVSSGLTPIAISAESPNFMFFDIAMSYCDSLLEDGNDDWVLPSIDDLTYAGSGGLVLPDSKTSNYLWSVTPYNNGAGVSTLTFINDLSSSIYWEALGSSNTNYNSNSSNKTRCIRRGAVTVSSSGGGSSSGGSSTPSTLGNGMPTMISNLSDSSMNFMSATFYCANLVESGYDDWILPNYEQISYAISGGCIFNDSRDGNTLWTRTIHSYKDVIILRDSYYNTNIGGIYSAIDYLESTDHNDTPYCRCVR